MDDEPKHAAHFAEKAAAFLPDAGHDDDRIGLDLAAGFQFAILVGHVDGKLPQFPVVQRRNCRLCSGHRVGGVREHS